MPGEQQVPPLEHDYLIVGEGAGDAALFRHLCAIHHLDHFQIEDAGGSTKLGTFVSGLKFRPNFRRLKAILIVRDSDDGPTASFNEVKVLLKKAGLPEPQGPLRHKRTEHGATDGLAIVVMLIPYSEAHGPQRGCLDTLLLQAFQPNQIPAHLQQCVTDFYNCIHVPRSPNNVDKFRVRCLLAAIKTSDPNFGLQWALNPTQGIFDLNHACFDEIVAFLANFVNLCEHPAY